MRSIKRTAVIIRVIGIVLLFLAAAMTIYSLASSGSAWKIMGDALNASGVQTGFMDRLSFNSAYYGAMSEIVSETDTAAAARAR